MNKTLQNNVIRIIAQNIEINWLQPYKNDDSNSAVGSGFFIDKEGYILTCSHLVIDSKKLFVEIPFEGREKHEVELVYVCPNFDIALLKTKTYKPKNFLQLIGNKEMYNINSGENVYAIGFPLGQNNLKISNGVISGRQKGLIQTSAPLNPGNSGGPLLYKNKVLGINISKITFASNVGYAAPISHYYVIDNYRKFGKKLVIRPNIGFNYYNTNKSYFKSKKISKCNGVKINFVYKESPAWKCGIRKGNVLCKINGIEIDNHGLINKRWFNEKMSLQDLINTFRIGDKIKIEYLNDKNKKIGTLKIEEFQPEITKKYPLFDDSNINYEIFGGIIVAEVNISSLKKIMNDTFRHHETFYNKTLASLLFWLNAENKQEKICIVTHIFANSIPKNEDILKVGDVLEKVNNVNIKNIDDYRRALSKSKDYISFITKNDKEYVLDLKDSLSQEEEFSENFKFNISKIYKKLSKKKKRN